MNLKIFPILLVLLLITTSCALNQTTTINNKEISSTNTITFFSNEVDTKAINFNSKEEYESFISSNSNNNYRGNYVNLGAKGFDSMMVESAEISFATDSVQSLDYSETNNQVKNVDEGDIIKTDGNYIYTISNNVLYIIKAYSGEDSEIISTYEFKQTPQGLFIYGNNLLVYENVNEYSVLAKDLLDKIIPGNPLTSVKLFDITNKEDIQLISEKIFEGYYLNSRMHNNNVYIVTQNYQSTHYPIYYDLGVRETSLKNIYYYNIPYNSPNFISINAMDILTGELTDQKIITTEYDKNLYMSENAIYLTSTQYLNEYDIYKEVYAKNIKQYLTREDEILILKIENTDSDILSNYEKENKIYQIYEKASLRLSVDEREKFIDDVQTIVDEKISEYKYFTYTVINKINFDDGKLSIQDYSKIPGRINNQFSMDEYQDVLRVATTIDSRWYNGQSTESENHIYVLDENLKVLDSIEGIAKTERIYSTRFIGEKLYMVTFRQVDPFFVFDLSKPNDIKELGQLKIPGFSRYLHPYDENHLIGIGRDATTSGRQEGLKISLFDVSDPANPKEVAKYVTESKYSSSNAEYEHKAFLFSKDKELLVIPAYSYDYQTQKGYNGAFVFKINEDEITLRGLIDHSNKQSTYYYGSSVERSLYIEDELYTKSLGLLRINSLDDLSSIKNITLETKNSDIPIY